MPKNNNNSDMVFSKYSTISKKILRKNPYFLKFFEIFLFEIYFLLFFGNEIDNKISNAAKISFVAFVDLKIWTSVATRRLPQISQIEKILENVFRKIIFLIFYTI
jgi:hypothetical protein